MSSSKHRRSKHPASKKFYSLFSSWEERKEERYENIDSLKKSERYDSDSSDSSDTDNTTWIPRKIYKTTKLMKDSHNFCSSDAEVSGNMKERQEPEMYVPHVMMQYNEMIAGTNVNFPMKPYSSQMAVMSMVIKGCTKGENSLIESPTGTGKTLALLCGALAWQDKRKREIQENSEKNMKSESSKATSVSEEDFSAKTFTYQKDVIKYESNDPATSQTCKKLEENVCETSTSYNSLWDIEQEKSLSDLLKTPKIPKIYYGTRTHKQIGQVVREFRKTIYKNKKMTILSGRQHTCIQETNRNKTELCNELLQPPKITGCPFYNKHNRITISTYHALEKHDMNRPWDIEDLVSLGKKTDACPYFAARHLMDEAEIIFCPYNYLIDPEIRESMQINLKEQIVILDEAHNIEGICRDVASVFIWSYQLEQAVHECALLSKSYSYCNAYDNIACYLSKMEKMIFNTELKMDISGNNTCDILSSNKLIELFNIHNIGQSSLKEFIRASKEVISYFNAAAEKKLTAPVISLSTKALLERLMFGLKIITSAEYAKDYRACIVEELATKVKEHKRRFADVSMSSKAKEIQYVRVLKLLCMHPGVIFAPLAATARSIILASGTLSPMNSFQSELDTKFANVLHASHVISKDQVYVRCLSKGPNDILLKASYDHVNKWEFQDELGCLLVDICSTVPHGVLCFLSSYKLITTLIDRWKGNNIWNKLCTTKRIFLEPRDNNELTGLMEEYRETIQNTSNGPMGSVTGALFLGVYRGKVAEGIDFSDDEARCVVTVGIPYAARSDPAIKTKTNYNDEHINKNLLDGRDWYTVHAFRALNQALGRCIRHKNDWGAVLLVDMRLTQENNVTYLPRWIKALWLQNKNYNLKQELQAFVKRQAQRESLNC